MVSVGMDAGATAHSIVRNIGEQIARWGAESSVAAWVSYYSPARNALRKATDGAGLEWSVQNETLQVVQRNGTTSRQAIVISSESGMIKSPEQARGRTGGGEGGGPNHGRPAPRVRINPGGVRDGRADEH